MRPFFKVGVEQAFGNIGKKSFPHGNNVFFRENALAQFAVARIEFVGEDVQKAIPKDIGIGVGNIVFGAAVFVNDGEQTMTAWIYTPQSAQDITFAATGSDVNLTVEQYELNL